MSERKPTTKPYKPYGGEQPDVIGRFIQRGVSESIPLYVVMAIQPWDTIVVDLPGCGYLPVFTDRGAAEQAYPGKDIMIVENRLKRE